MITTRDSGPIVLDVRPIEPHSGYIRTPISRVSGTAIIATRTHNNYLPDHQVRLFTGDVTPTPGPAPCSAPGRQGKDRCSA